MLSAPSRKSVWNRKDTLPLCPECRDDGSPIDQNPPLEKRGYSDFFYMRDKAKNLCFISWFVLGFFVLNAFSLAESTFSKWDGDQQWGITSEATACGVSILYGCLSVSRESHSERLTSSGSHTMWSPCLQTWAGPSSGWWGHLLSVSSSFRWFSSK